MNSPAGILTNFIPMEFANGLAGCRGGAAAPGRNQRIEVTHIRSGAVRGSLGLFVNLHVQTIKRNRLRRFTRMDRMPYAQVHEIAHEMSRAVEHQNVNAAGVHASRRCFARPRHPEVARHALIHYVGRTEEFHNLRTSNDVIRTKATAVGTVCIAMDAVAICNATAILSQRRRPPRVYWSESRGNSSMATVVARPLTMSFFEKDLLMPAMPLPH